MKLVIITLSKATIVGASILDYQVEGNKLHIHTKSGKFKVVFGSKEGISNESENATNEATKAKNDIDMFLIGDSACLKIENCEIWS